MPARAATLSSGTLILLSGLMLGSACSKLQDGEASQAKIVHGRPVAAGSAVAKSTVALVKPNGFQFCSGVLLDARHVLTAAHCRSDFSGAFLVAFGVAANTDALDQDHLIEGASFKSHPSFNSTVVRGGLSDRPGNDVAVVTLASDAPADYAPAPLLSADDALEAGETLTLAGYGLTGASERGTNGVLRQTSVRLLEASEPAKELLVGDGQGQACGGDSGGPAYVRRQGQLVLAGVTSRGENRCTGRAVYTDVRYFLDWINRA